MSYREIEELMAEAGVKVDHATISCWVVEYSPQLEAAFTQQHKRAVGHIWRMDEA